MLPGSSLSYFCLRRFASPVWILLVRVFIVAFAACNVCRAPGEIGGGGVGVGVGGGVGAEAAATAFVIRSKWSCSHHHRDRRVQGMFRFPSFVGRGLGLRRLFVCIVCACCALLRPFFPAIWFQ